MISVASPAMLAVINLVIPLTFSASAINRCRKDIGGRIDRVLNTHPHDRTLPRPDLREESAAVIRHVCSFCPARMSGACRGVAALERPRVA